jgi:RNA polymerase sigma factor (TIGR02999 family)
MRQAVPRPSIDTVYSELRQLAAGHLAREPGYGRLSPTSLVHVTYQRLLGKAGEGGWENRRHFFAAASEAMRRILIEQARRRLAQKRGGNARQEWLDMNEVAATMPDDDLVALNEALDEFAADEPDKAELVKLRFFAVSRKPRPQPPLASLAQPRLDSGRTPGPGCLIGSGRKKDDDEKKAELS